MVAAQLSPEYDRGPDSKAILDMIEFLLDDGWAVSFVAERGGTPAGERYMRMLRQRGVAAYGGTGERTDELMAYGDFDLAICETWPVAERLLPRLRALSPRTPVIVHIIDLHLLHAARHGLAAGGLLDADYGANVARELNVYSHCDGVLAISDREVELIHDLLGDTTLASMVPLAEDQAASPVGFDDRSGLIFVGNYQHPHNFEAVEWLLTEIVPALPAGALKNHPLRILGDALPASVSKLAEGVGGVQLVGWVPSLVPYLQHARVSVVPLLHGAGAKLNVVRSLASGTPVVSTSIGLEGLGLHHRKQALCANDVQSFAAAMARLVSDRRLWTRVSEGGQAATRTRHGRNEAQSRFQAAVTAVLARKAKKAISGAEELQLAERLLKPRYLDLVEGIRGVAGDALPPGSRAAVVSHGDDELLRLGEADAEHFPADWRGVWLGWHPADGSQAIAMLEEAVARGVDHLVLPKTAAWWLEQYPELAQMLERDWHEVVSDPDTCVVYARGMNGHAGPGKDGHRVGRRTKSIHRTGS